MAHRLVYHPTLGLMVIKKKKSEISESAPKVYISNPKSPTPNPKQ